MRVLRVGIFMGGNSEEREVSFNSGRTVYDHLDRRLYAALPIFQTRCGKLYLLAQKFMHRGKIADFEQRLAQESSRITWTQLKELVDIIYITAHGPYVEDGRLQAMLELLAIPYTGSKVYASALCMDKIEQKKVVAQLGIAVPKGIAYAPSLLATLTNAQVIRDMQTHFIEFPVIVKPTHGGSSIGVTAVQSAEHLIAALNHAAYIEQTPQAVLIEEQLVGMEFSCSFLYDYATQRWLPLSITEIIPDATRGFLCYDQKYMPGKAIKYTPARCAPALIEAIHACCVRILNALELRTVARIDGFYTHDKRIVIIDVNPLCGMDPASFLFREAAEQHMTHRDVIQHIIAAELHAYGIAQEQSDKEIMLQPQQRTRVAVIFGGANSEREISFASGRNVIYKLPADTYDTLPIFMSSTRQLYHITRELLIKNRTAEIEELVTQTMLINLEDLTELTDFVFIALHGDCGENGVLQGALEMLGLPYNGSSVLTSARCIDKYKTTTYLRAGGFSVPFALLVAQTSYATDPDTVCTTITQQLSFPLIIKPHNDGCSTLVHSVTSVQELHQALNVIFAAKKSHALIEEYIVGTELTVGCLGNDTVMVLPPTMVVRNNAILTLQEKFLPGAGENQTPAPLDAATVATISYTIKQVYTYLQCRSYARIDCFYQTAEQSPTGMPRIVIIEVNTLPGLTPATCLFHQAAEINMQPSTLLATIIELGFQAHALRTEHQKHYTPTMGAKKDIQHMLQ